MRQRWVLLAALIAIGAAWGMTQPMAKVAVSEGYQHFGLIFWQMVIGAVLLGTVTWMRGAWFKLTRSRLAFLTMIALIGTVLPNSASYQAAAHLPSGVMSIVLSLVPMLAFPIALVLGLERFSGVRLIGLSLGLVGVALIALPKASLPDPAMVGWVMVALVAPIFYASEGNIVSKWGTHGLDAVQVLFGASSIGAVLALFLTLATGQWIDPRPPYGAPDGGLVASAVLHAFAYTGYVWLVGRAGAVFAVQVSYLVTGFGIVWAILLLSEAYSPYIWAALGLMFTGLFLVQPRKYERS
ncbi:DMT family transporter [Nereida sp. MMG025]|uniref:DMT family transporter n=1 Tax=Nereida sp. MMG025 TaxID=2909981 RepID=UPI001F1F4693|nr:DMT family transporter [Nereida sp. MMG025]MCF6443935.1 DMT family transporter [Nereida sp. MMG025]